MFPPGGTCASLGTPAVLLYLGMSRGFCFKAAYSPFQGDSSLSSSCVWLGVGRCRSRSIKTPLLALGQVILAWLPLEPTTLVGSCHHGRTVDLGHRCACSLHSASYSITLGESQMFVSGESSSVKKNSDSLPHKALRKRSKYCKTQI